jgi:hypothetical protein
MHMKNLYAVAALVLTQALGHAQSITVGYQAAAFQKDVVYNGGAAVPDGNYVRVGFFNSGFNVAANAANLNALTGAWNEFGFTTITNIFGQPGRFGGSQSSFDPKFDSQKICLWIFDTINNAAPTANFDNVIGYGVFSAGLPNWLFPQSGAVPPGNSTQVTSDQVNQAYFGAFDSAHLSLSPVPEPGTYALLALGAVPFLVARWRRITNARK